MPNLPRRLMLATLALGWIVAAAPAGASEAAPWTDAAFATAREAGRPIIVEIAAPWCPTCVVQGPIVEAVMAEPDMAGALLLTVDFDSQKPALRQLRARHQSTIIVFRGAEERGRSIGVTNPAEIRALIRRAL